MKTPRHQPTRPSLEGTRFFKSQVATGIATGAEWLCVWLLVSAQLYYVHAAIAGALAGAVTDFGIKKVWVFDTALHKGPMEALRYAAVSGTSALLFGAAVFAFVDRLAWSMPVSVVAASALVGVLWNYPLHRLFVFSSVSVRSRS